MQPFTGDSRLDVAGWLVRGHKNLVRIVQTEPGKIGQQTVLVRHGQVNLARPTANSSMTDSAMA